VAIELYAEGIKGGAPVRQEMKLIRQLGTAGMYAYSATVLWPVPQQTIQRE